MRHGTEAIKITIARQGSLYEEDSILEEFKTYYKNRCLSYECDIVDGTHHFHMENPERLLL